MLVNPISPPPGVCRSKLVGPRTLKRAWNPLPGAITGAVLAMMRGGLSEPSVRCSSRVGGTSSPPMPVVDAETHHVPARPNAR